MRRPPPISLKRSRPVSAPARCASGGGLRRAATQGLGLGLAAILAACGSGGARVEPEASVDVLADLYVRGGPADAGAPGRVALTFDGPGRCTADLLATLKAPAPGLEPLKATFFWDAASAEAARRDDGVAFGRLAARLGAEQHEVALGPKALSPAQLAAAPRLRTDLAEQARELAQTLAAGGFAQRGPAQLWRPPAAGFDLAALGQAAAVDRPLVLWTRRPAATDPAALVAEVAARLSDGDILALPSDDAGCVAVRALPALAAALAEAGLQTVTVTELLGRALRRHSPPRVVRYRGAGLTATCAANLGLGTSGSASEAASGVQDVEAVADRFGLLVGEGPQAVTVLPLPEAATTAALLRAGAVGAETVSGAGPGGAGGAGASVAGRAAAAWRLGAWRGAPGCLRTVERARLLSPVTLEGHDGRARVWRVAEVGIEAHDARALGAPEGALVLPDLTDLVRLEARQRLPWRLRGLVAGALRQLSLEVPMLVEARASLGVVVGVALDPPARAGGLAAAESGSALAGFEAKVQPPGEDSATAGPIAHADGLADAERPVPVPASAVAGYVQVVEWSLGEYLYLARRNPAALPDLQRAARGADGFLRAGPFLVLPDGAGSGPDPARLGPDGEPLLGADPTVLLGRVLAAGHRLRPGDLVVAAPAPVVGPPDTLPPADTDSLRAALRRGLASAVAVGFRRADYLRPGALLTVEGDQLGRQPLRVAVPPGVAAPTRDALPLVAPRPTEAERPSEAERPTAPAGPGGAR